MELLKGFDHQLSLPNTDHRINFQRAVASTRELGMLLRRNVLDQLVFQREEHLKGAGVNIRTGHRTIEDVPTIFRHYSAGRLFVSYAYAENGPEEAIFIRKTDPAKRWRVELGINRQAEIQMLLAASGAPLRAEKLTLSSSPTELWCEVETICGAGSYIYTATPKSERPAIEYDTQKIRCITQRITDILA